ncbi:hypothetical protein FUB08_06130 [Vibrio cholerae]|nr:hypothetical protein [Vibrio cholerae]
MTDEIKEIETLFDELGYPKDAPVTLKVRHLMAMAKSLKEENCWIKVNECLPKECDSKHESIFVDVYGEGERWPNCYYDFVDEQWIDPDIGGPITINVTHWKKITLPVELI